MQHLTGKSRVFGIFGDPVAHSLSPMMHNQAFAFAGIDAVYVPFHVTAEALPLAVEGLRCLQIAGVNVTIPHKEKILPLLDEVDTRARLVGAVNTVVNRQGRLIGYNTDCLGFLRSAEQELGYAPSGSRVLLLGAGGACRAALTVLAGAGVAEVTIVNRTLRRAQSLAAEFADHFPATRIRAFSPGDAELQRIAAELDLLVNATSLGLKGESVNFFPLEYIKPSALIYDMVYSLIETPLLQAARIRGLRTADGLGMLAGQGEEAFFLWTGVRLPTGFMKDSLIRYRENGN